MFDTERLSLSCVEVELEPNQPEEITRAVEDLLRDAEPAVDPWWQAGIDEALET